jgi:3-methyladenine DNA glycosylase Tag
VKVKRQKAWVVAAQGQPQLLKSPATASFLGERMQEQEHEWQMPTWWIRGKRPASDAVYFENMCHVIFQAGLNWQVTDKKWPNIKEAFCNFNIEKVACLTDTDVQEMLQNSGIIRNKGKIQATIRNAQTFLAIEKQYGSFQKYLDSIDKTNNFAEVIKTLVNNFKWLGSPSASTFLYTVGENIDVWGHE